MASAEKWLYLPIDVKSRELDAKIFLSSLAAQKGWLAVLGQKKDVSQAASHLPPGVFVGFGAHKNFAEKYKRLKKRGGRIACLDEEGLVTWSAEIFGKMRISEETIPFIDRYFCWGDAHAEIVKEVAPELHSKCRVTGNPRLDVLRADFEGLYKNEVDRIKRTHGDFILINSNFGTCNHYLGTDAYFESLKEKKIITSPEREQFYRDYIDYRSKILGSFCDALPALSKAFPDKTIIVRPHPSESRTRWQQAADGLINVKVIHEGTVIPWFIAARAIVHNFCTTSVEAFLMNRPVIAYRPIIDSRLETELPSLVSIQVTDERALIATLSNVLNKSAQPLSATDSKKIEHYVANLGGATAVERILHELETITDKQPAYAGKEIIRFRLRNLKERLSGWISNKAFQKTDYIQHKFAELTKTEIMGILSAMPASVAQGIIVTPLHNGTFLFQKK